MRRTVVIDDELLDEAQEALGTKGIRESTFFGNGLVAIDRRI